MSDGIQAIIDRLDRIERLLNDQKTIKDFYTMAEVAKILDKSDYTVREWARLGRIAATKRACGRGSSTEWIVSNQELTRLQNEGLLPNRTARGA